ncbi:hypothetical protein OGATHE_003168 [Ogataea polymorpha]|uniref:Uncharacterized protein n=1 Tax=Ogataea polymorpha TaxID=460523 RepID=A0A9P8P9U3_9ASCO|nr:hypothetical protein OGATHE_003168 [Ogataea polymorpha]
MVQKTVNGRFNVVVIGVLGGFLMSFYVLKEYQLIKYTPPSPENFDENGNWKHPSFFRIRFSDRIEPLQPKPRASQLEDDSTDPKTPRS